ncbi:uncharacterized protein TNCV_4186431 [Trichonephila clavipes]|nr:uncharacterized protein TNCV_4186431 [Trichonephila clavipes]
MFDSSSYDNPTPLAHADASRDVLPREGTSQICGDSRLQHSAFVTCFLDCSPTPYKVAAVAEWSRYWIVASLVTSLSPEPLKTRCVGQRCTLNPWRAQTSSRWCGVVVRREGASSGVVHVTRP